MDQQAHPVPLSWIAIWSGMGWPFLSTSPFLPVWKSIFSELFLSKGKKKVSLDSSSHVVAQPGVLMFGVQGLAGWIHRALPVGVGSSRAEGFLLLCLPLHHSSLLQVSLAQHGNCFSQLRIAAYTSWKAVTGRVNLMAKFVLAISWGLSQIPSKSPPYLLVEVL